MDPVTAWTITKTAADAIKQLFVFGKSLKDRDKQHQVDQILDTLRDLKQSASELEDENRELREQLRFRSDDYEFRTPFWYEKTHPERALCPKCHANGKTGVMGEKGQGCHYDYRCCLACDSNFEVSQTRRNRTDPIQQQTDGPW